MSNKKTQSNSEFESKVKDIFEEGVKVLKEGIFGLEVMASKTVEVAKIKLDHQSLQKEIKQNYHDLGQILFTKLSQSQAKTMKITDEMRDLTKEIKSSKKKLSAIEKQMDHYSTVEKKSKSRKK